MNLSFAISDSPCVVIPSEAGRLFFRSHGERRPAQSRNFFFLHMFYVENLLFLANAEGVNG
jgi:hypothetical protein